MLKVEFPADVHQLASGYGDRETSLADLNDFVVSENNITGRKGEDLAAEFLIRNGYEILRRNFTFRRCEIDIVALKDDWLLFIEVKTRSSVDFGHPEEFVEAAQAARIIYAAEEFIFTSNWQGHIRFDIISITMNSTPKIVHFEDAIN